MLVCALAGFALTVGAASASADWTYERVTPSDKSGGGLMSNTYRAAPDGSGLLYTVTGSMSGVPALSSPMYTRYLATRGKAAWENRAIDPAWDLGVPPSQAQFTIQLTLGSSQSLEWIVQTSNDALTPGATQNGSNLYALNTRTNQRQLIFTTPDRRAFTNPAAQAGTGALAIRFVGNDGTVWFGEPNLNLDPGAPGAVAYRWNPNTGVEAVGRKPLAEGGTYATRGSLGSSQAMTGIPSPIVPWFSEGNVYFNDSSAGSNNFGDGVYMLGATGSDPMVSLSLDRSSAATGVRAAHLHGASANGRYAVFQVMRQGAKLTDGTPDLGAQARYIYRYDSQTDTLLSIGATRDNNPNDRDGVQEISPDGKSIFFLSQIVQAPGAIDGRANLYLWREGQPLKLIRTSDVGSSGASQVTRLGMLSDNGRYFMFTDNSYSVAQQFGYDNRSVACSTTTSPAPCDVVYRYDIAQDRFDCVSCRPDGALPQGHAGAPLIRGSMSQMPMDFRLPQYVADDGTVFFDTADPVVSADANGLEDTYAWRDGNVRLVSRASSGQRSRFIDATPDGRSVFFATADQIVRSDIDRSQDIYVARLDGGFDDSGDGAPAACQGSDCRQPAAAGGPILPLPSQGILPSDVLRKPVGEERSRVRVVSIRWKGRYARVVVQPSGDGMIRFSGRGLVRTERKARGTRAFAVRVRLAKRTLRKVRKRGSRVRVKMSVRYTPAFGKAAKAQRRLTVKGR